jgi:hypothetical protein
VILRRAVRFGKTMLAARRCLRLLASGDPMFTSDPNEAEQPPEDHVAWEPMEEYGETEADRLYFRRGVLRKDSEPV